MLIWPEVTGATDPRRSLAGALEDIKMKPANYFWLELPEVVSEPPVKFPWVGKRLLDLMARLVCSASALLRRHRCLKFSCTLVS